MNLDWIQIYFGDKESTIAKDLKLNLSRLLTESTLGEEDRLLALAALAQANHDHVLKKSAVDALKTLGTSDEWIQEAIESTAMMAMLNTYYKFRGLTADATPYSSAGLRMTALAKPALGKLRFEMLAFAVSVHNACPSCVQSHEKVLLDGGVSQPQIHDLARMAAVVKACSTLTLKDP